MAKNKKRYQIIFSDFSFQSSCVWNRTTWMRTRAPTLVASSGWCTPPRIPSNYPGSCSESTLHAGVSPSTWYVVTHFIFTTGLPGGYQYVPHLQKRKLRRKELKWLCQGQYFCLSPSTTVNNNPWPVSQSALRSVRLVLNKHADRVLVSVDTPVCVTPSWLSQCVTPCHCYYVCDDDLWSATFSVTTVIFLAFFKR